MAIKSILWYLKVYVLIEKKNFNECRLNLYVLTYLISVCNSYNNICIFNFF